MTLINLIIIFVAGLFALSVMLGFFYAFIQPKYMTFNKCFLCKKKELVIREPPVFDIEYLKQVIHPPDYGTDTEYSYYHETCLKRVFNSPELHTKHIDRAIKIYNQINSDALKASEKIKAAKLKIEQAKNLGPVEEKLPENSKGTVPKAHDRYTLLKKIK